VSETKLPANIDYPWCVGCKERRGIIQVRMLKSEHSEPYCAECARPLIVGPRSKVGAIGATQ
jgi:hypothetical protein